MFVHKENPPFTVEMGNVPDASTRSAGVKSNVAEERKTAEPGGKLHRWVAVSFCLLCVLQAVLNISLRLALSSPDTDAKNLTEEGDNLTSINFDFNERIKNLTDEKEELMRTLHDLALQNNSLTRERNELQTQLNINALQKISLTRERDELQTQLNDFALQQNTLTRERDELKTKLNEFAHYSNQGWVYFRGSFYYISLLKKNWQNSRADCQRRGADLMIVNSYEEQEFTRRGQNDEIMWIGLNDIETEGRWKWVDGTPLTTSFWEPGEPNNANTIEHCVQVKFSQIRSTWNDAPCGHQDFWICEKNIDL